MTNPFAGVLVAIDGPSGSGKSTVSKQVARELGIGYLDTGAMYRSLTWLCLEQGIDLSDEKAVRAVADRLSFRIEPDPDNPHFYVGSREITEDIREPRIANSVAQVAKNLQVRAWMATEQRRIMLEARESRTGMVAEGRDITTVVCPDADIRVLLVATEETRLRRRTLELYGEITDANLAATEAQIGARDRSDAKVSQFLEAAPGVTTIDSSNATISEVVTQIVAITTETVE